MAWHFLKHNIRTLVLATIAMALVVLVLRAKILSEASRTKLNEWSRMTVEVPFGAPDVSQESIDLALVLFNIQIPESADHPVLNKKLDDRGLSTRLSWRKSIKVEIGPSAFSSWSILGSTLGHELEIHCRQNFMLINVMDSLGLSGTSWAERQAYMYEIRNAERFGLTAYQRDLIASTMRYYYSMDKEEAAVHLPSRFKSKLGRWLARSVVLDTRAP